MNSGRRDEKSLFQEEGAEATIVRWIGKTTLKGSPVDLRMPLMFLAHQPHPIPSLPSLRTSTPSSAAIGLKMCLIKADLQRSWGTLARRRSR